MVRVTNKGSNPYGLPSVKGRKDLPLLERGAHLDLEEEHAAAFGEHVEVVKLEKIGFLVFEMVKEGVEHEPEAPAPEAPKAEANASDFMAPPSEDAPKD